MLNFHRVMGGRPRSPIIDAHNMEYSYDLLTWRPIPFSNAQAFIYRHVQCDVLVVCADNTVWRWRPSTGIRLRLFETYEGSRLAPVPDGVAGVYQDTGDEVKFARWRGWPPEAEPVRVLPRGDWNEYQVLRDAPRLVGVGGTLFVVNGPVVGSDGFRGSPVRISGDDGDTWSIVDVSRWRAYAGASDWGYSYTRYETGRVGSNGSINIVGGIEPIAATANGVIALARGGWSSRTEDTRPDSSYIRESSTLFHELVHVDHSGAVNLIKTLWLMRTEFDDNYIHESATGTPASGGPVHLPDGRVLIWEIDGDGLHRKHANWRILSPDNATTTPIAAAPWSLNSKGNYSVIVLPDGRLASATMEWWGMLDHDKTWYIYDEDTGIWTTQNFEKSRNLVSFNNNRPMYHAIVSPHI